MGEHMNAAKHFKVAALVRYVHKNDHQADHLIEVDLFQQIRGPDDLDYFLRPWHVGQVPYVQSTRDMDLPLGLYILNCIDPLGVHEAEKGRLQ